MDEQKQDVSGSGAPGRRALSDQLDELIQAVKDLRSEPPKGRWNRSREFLDSSIKYGAKAAVLVVGLAGLVYVVHEVFIKDTVLIEPFSVPKDLSDAGYGSAVLAEQVASQIRQVLEEETLSKKREFSLASEDSVPDIEVPETKMSIKSLVSFLRTLFHRQPATVNAAVIREATGYLVKVSVKNGPRTVPQHTATFQHDLEIRKLIPSSAYMVMRFTDPWPIGHYLLQRRDPESRRELEQLIAANRNCTVPSHRAAAANLAGSLSDRAGESRDALVKFEQAVKEDPKNPLYEIDRGWGLERTGQLKEAVAAYQKAIQLGGKIPLAYNDLGSAYFQLRDSKNALLWVHKTLSLPNADSTARATATWGWAEILTADKEAARKDRSAYRQRVVSKYQEAVKLDPLGRIFDAWGDFLMDNDDPRGTLQAYRSGCETPDSPSSDACLKAAAEIAGPETADRAALYSYWQRALKFTDRPGETYYSVGAGEEAIGHRQHAGADYHAALAVLTNPAQVQVVQERLAQLLKPSRQ